MNETAVLYTLTTLAQSCAALAAFVGAVGVFRIQLLRDQRHNAERELRTSSENLVGRDVHAVSLSEVLGAINKAGEKHPDRQRAIAEEADSAISPRETPRSWRASPVQSRLTGDQSLHVSRIAVSTRLGIVYCPASGWSFTYFSTTTIV